MKNNKMDFAKLQTLKVEGDVLKAGFSLALSGGTEVPQSTNSGNCVAGCSGTVNRFICVN